MTPGLAALLLGLTVRHVRHLGDVGDRQGHEDRSSHGVQPMTADATALATAPSTARQAPQRRAGSARHRQGAGPRGAQGARPQGREPGAQRRRADAADGTVGQRQDHAAVDPRLHPDADSRARCAVAGAFHGEGLTPEELAALRRRHIGFIFQSYNLFPTLTAEENVRIALDVRGERGSEAIVRAQRALQQVGLRHKLKSYPANLSGGEQQRVAVARALVGRTVGACWRTSRRRRSTARTGWPSCSSCRRSPRTRAARCSPSPTIPRTIPFANRVLRIEDGLIVGEERRAEGVETVHQLARNRKRKANA